tara:strand:- start:6098 stop:7186 length:1089 start_codon:yes stop_codon:yes gene_type:complete
MKKTLCFFTTVDWFIISHRNELFKLLLTEFEITVIVFEDTGKLKKYWPDLNIIRLPSSRDGLSIIDMLKSLVKLKNVLIKNNFDILYTVGIRTVFYALFIEFIGIKVKYIYTISGLGSLFTAKNNFIYNIIQKVFYFLVRRSSGLYIVQNNDDKNKFQSLGNKRVELILGSGVDLKKFKNNRIVSKIDRVVFLGRLLKSKGIDDFISVANYFKDSDLDFQILGSIDNNVESLSKKDIDNFPSNITYLGYSNDVSKVLLDASLMILPSRREGLSLSLCEAAASGLPLITYDVPGCKEVCVDNFNGIVCKPYVIEDIINAVEKLISDPNLVVRYSRNSREHAETNFCIKNINKTLLDCVLKEYK